jgi:hypothetical protein
MVAKSSGPPLAPVQVQVIDPRMIEVQYRNQRMAGLLVTDPAYGQFTALAAKRWGALSVASGLKTETPPGVIILADDQNLYLAPVLDHPMAEKVIYNDGRAFINLIRVFTQFSRVLPPGTTEFYKLEGRQTVQAGEETFVALKLPLKKVPPRVSATAVARSRAPKPAKRTKGNGENKGNRENKGNPENKGNAGAKA